MYRVITVLSLAVVGIFFVQSGLNLAGESTVPGLVQFNGVIENSGSQAQPGIQSVTFALYKDDREGPPLWQETQNVAVDSNGRFGVLLGAGTQGGIPKELFAAGDPRWLGVQGNGNGQVEQPRILLLSVPYALKAADAETLGGRPLSDFVLAGTVANTSKEAPCNASCPKSLGIAPTLIVDADIDPIAAISPTKVAGTAATLGTNTFNGKQTISNGNLALPLTSANGTSGMLTIGGLPFLHRYGGSNTFLGNQAGNTFMTGIANTIVGEFGLAKNTSGHHNTAMGAGVLFQNTSGSNNTAAGISTLGSNTTGSDNTATGYYALAYNKTGMDNTAVGNQAIFSSTDGTGNTAVGSGALLGLTNGSYNTAIGYRTLEINASGSGNTAVGYGAGTAGLSNFNGHSNTFIGNSTGAGIDGLYRSTAIGYGAQVAKSNSVVIGSLGAMVGIGINAPEEKLDVLGNILIGDNWYGYGCIKERNGTVIGGFCSSDQRLKQNIEPFEPVLEKLVQVQPVYFDWRTDEFPEFHLGTSRSSGLIAQDVEKVFPEMVAEDARGFKAVEYSQLPLLLLQAIREQQEQIVQLRSQLELLKKQTAAEAR